MKEECMLAWYYVVCIRVKKATHTRDNRGARDGALKIGGEKERESYFWIDGDCQ